jgi:hypothetical protein
MISRGGHGYKNAQVTMSHERTALTASPEGLVSWSLTMAGPIPQEMLYATAAKINSGQKDEFGGKGVNAFYTDDQAPVPHRGRHHRGQELRPRVG